MNAIWQGLVVVGFAASIALSTSIAAAQGGRFGGGRYGDSEGRGYGWRPGGEGDGRGYGPRPGEGGGPGYGPRPGEGGGPGYGPRPDQPMSAEDAAARVRRAEFFLQELDQNRNGVIEAEEVEGRRRFYVDMMLQRAGLASEYPVAISRLQEGLRAHYQAAASGTPQPMSPGPPGSPSSAAAGGSSGTAGSAAQPLVPGFEVATNLPPVPGFEVVPITVAAAPAGGTSPAAAPATSGASSGSSSSSGSGASSSSSSSGSGAGELEERYRRYAQELLRKYDKNENGQLERDEWKEMSGNPENADRNRDGVITLDELTAHLMEMGRGGSSGGGSSTGGSREGGSREGGSSRDGASGGSSSASSGDGGAIRSDYRFRSAAERLPDGLPDWFLEKDLDGDGQVSMAEFTTSWTDAKVAEFRRYDLNGDGYITPYECLDGMKAPPAADGDQSASSGAGGSSAGSTGGSTTGSSGGAPTSSTAGSTSGSFGERREPSGDSRDRRPTWGRR